MNQKADTKKTLMNAVERLAMTAKKIEELTRRSNDLVSKFERTEGIPLPEQLPTKDTELIGVRPPSIIDLFDDINDQLDKSHDNILSNINRVVNMIE